MKNRSGVVVASTVLIVAWAGHALADDQYAKYGFGLPPKDPCYPQHVLDLAELASHASAEEFAALRRQVLAAIAEKELDCRKPRPCCIDPDPADTATVREVRAEYEDGSMVFRVAQLRPDGVEIGTGQVFGRVPASSDARFEVVQVDRSFTHGPDLMGDRYFFFDPVTRYTAWTRAKREEDVKGDPGTVTWSHTGGWVRVALRGGPAGGTLSSVTAGEFDPDSTKLEPEMVEMFRAPLTFLVAEDPGLALLRVEGSKCVKDSASAGTALVLNASGHEHLIFTRVADKGRTAQILDLTGPAGTPESWTEYVARIRESGSLPLELVPVFRAFLREDRRGRILAIGTSRGTEGDAANPLGLLETQQASNSTRPIAPVGAESGIVLVDKEGHGIRITSPKNSAAAFAIDSISGIHFDREWAPEAEHAISLLALRDPSASLLAYGDSARSDAILSHGAVYGWQFGSSGVPKQTTLVGPGARFALSNIAVSEYLTQLQPATHSEPDHVLLRWADRGRAPTLLDAWGYETGGEPTILYSPSGHFTDSGDLADGVVVRGLTGEPEPAAIHLVEPTAPPIRSISARYQRIRTQAIQRFNERGPGLGVWLGPERTSFVMGALPGHRHLEVWSSAGAQTIRVRPSEFSVVEFLQKVQQRLRREYEVGWKPTEDNVLHGLVAKHPELFGWHSDLLGILDLLSGGAK